MFTIIKRRLSSLWISWILFIRSIQKIRIGFFTFIHRSFVLLTQRDTWPLTDEQIDRNVNEFLQAIDEDALRSLASEHHNNQTCEIKARHRGSFNTCFVLEFSDQSTRIIRIPHEPAVQDAWDKMRSEVSTMRYLRHKTTIPVPVIYTYGRSQLRRDTSEPQCFMILEHIKGQSLTKTTLKGSSEPYRRQFLEQLIDLFAELRKLPFTQGGSLVEGDAENTLDLVGAFSMRKSELHAAGHTVSRSLNATPQEFFQDQRCLLHQMWTVPEKRLGYEQAERQEFALQFISQPEVEERLAIQSSDKTFFLAHPDLRCQNILVDGELNIRGVIDWEYTATVPRCASIPPTWITGNDKGLPDLSSEFLRVLSSTRQKSEYHSQLAADWGFQDPLRWSILHVLIDPVDLDFIFQQNILRNIPALCGIPSPDPLQMRRNVDQRLETSRHYTKYLQDNSLDEEGHYEKMERLLRSSQAMIRDLEAGQFSPQE
ncbi:phosphotransferase enzyme family protein [Hirsutella rhossiliensis]|uniref:Phosphotransferase enzyme family domain-containing protein n=1 Tax=Hirsutella rhossiliensis TaxID=111463 RepID=A0A9P8MU14_9HYPO|nr:phosphotransferase enzyme family domain-containing protein [Hirsutella rhossiliensis]KAH0960419.1 phosphotransferase enzyme family domain-containing protein [Hirsutella rhossiliensis]